MRQGRILLSLALLIGLVGSSFALVSALRSQSTPGASSTSITHVQPTTSSQPTSSQPTSSQPTSSQPTSSQPTSSQPTSSQPASSQPASSQPASSQPTTSSQPTSSYALQPGVIVIPPADDVSLSVNNSASPPTEELVLTSTSLTSALTPGTIIISATSPTIQSAYMLSITSITPVANNQLLIAGTFPKLTQVFSYLNVAGTDTLVPSYSGQSLATATSNDWRTTNGAINPNSTFHNPFSNLSLTCTTSAGISVHPIFRLSPTFSFNINVNTFFGIPTSVNSLRLTGTLVETAGLDLNAQAGADCSASIPLLGTSGLPLPPIPVGVPFLTLTPSLQVTITGSAQVSASLNATITQDATVTLGVAYANSHLSPISSVYSHFHHSITIAGGASVSLGLRPSITVAVDDIAGPSFDVGASLVLSASVTSQPWWQLQGCIYGGVGFTIPLLSESFSDPRLFQKCYPIAEASPTSTPPPALAPNLGITVGAPSSISPGGSVSYTLTPQATGSVTNPITITDTLPTGLTLAGSPSASSSQMSCTGHTTVVCTYTPNGTVTNPNLGTITIPVTLAVTAPPGQVIDYATIADSGDDAVAMTASATSSIAQGSANTLGAGNPTLGWSEHPGGPLTSVSCPTTTFCMAVDDAGNALIYTNGTWSTPDYIDTNEDLASVSCPTTTFCMAVGFTDALTYTNGTWSTPDNIDPNGGGPNSVSCPTTTFCMAVGSGYFVARES